MGIILVKPDAIHDRAEQLADVAVDVQMLTCFEKIGFRELQQISKVWNQSQIGIRIFEA